MALVDHGSVFQKGLMRALVPAGAENLRVDLRLASITRQTVVGLIYDDRLRPRRAGEIELAADRKPESLSLPLDCLALPEYQHVPNRARERHGTGDVRITEVLFFSDETPLPTTRLTQLQPFALEIRLQKINPSAVDIEIVVAFQRDGVLDCMRAFSSTLKMSSGSGANVVRLAADLMPLGAGEYKITVLVAKAGYYEFEPDKVLFDKSWRNRCPAQVTTNNRGPSSFCLSRHHHCLCSPVVAIPTYRQRIRTEIFCAIQFSYCGLRAIIAMQPEFDKGWRWNAGVADAATQARLKDWELVCEKGLFPLSIEWFYGTTMEFSCPSQIVRQIYVYGSYQPNEFALLDRILAPGMTLVDVGANDGLFTIAGAHKVGPAGKVLAFEPSEREFQILNRNIALNKLDNVVAIQRGVLDVEGRARFFLASREFSGLSGFGEIDAINFKTLPNVRVAWSSVIGKEDKVSWVSLSNGEAIVKSIDKPVVEIKIYSESDFVYNLYGISVDLTPLNKLLCLYQWGLFCLNQWVRARRLTNEREKSNTELMRRVRPLLISTKGNITTQAIKRQNKNYVRICGSAKSEINFRLRTIVRGPKQILISGEGQRLIEPETYEVNCVKLDNVCGRLGVERIEVIKIDVEGAEMAVLRGASSIIKKHRPLLIIELSDKHLIRQGSSVSEVVEFLRAERYKIVDVDGGQCAIVDIPLPREGDFVAVHEDKLHELRRVLTSP